MTENPRPAANTIPLPAGAPQGGVVVVSWVRLAVLVGSGGLGAHWDFRTRTIPDVAWIGDLTAEILLELAGGPSARWAALAGGAIAAGAFAPGLLVRRGGQPLSPPADWWLAVALGSLAGLVALSAVTVAAAMGLGVGQVMLAFEEGKVRPPHAAALAVAFVTAAAWPLLGRCGWRAELA